MNKEQFIDILKKIELLREQNNEYSKFGIDLLESPYPVAVTSYKIIDMFFEAIYGKEGLDWIEWFIYENDFGRNKYEAWDEDNKLICQTIEELYEYVERYRRIW